MYGCNCRRGVSAAIADCESSLQAARPRPRLGPNGSFAIAGCECSLQAARTRGVRSEWLVYNCRLRMHHAGSPPKGDVRFEWLVCNCRLRMHHAGSPHKGEVGEVGARMARLQMRIADAPCKQPAQGKGWGPNGSAANADCGYAMQAARPREGFGSQIAS